MNSVALSPSEFWFYRVYSELTLSLLHQVNNELTGVSFLTELIQDDVEAGTPPGEKFSDLQSSVEKIIRLTQQTIEAHLPIPSDMSEPSTDLGVLIQDGVSMLRLVLPKTITIRIEPLPSCAPEIAIAQKDFGQLLAAIGLLLAPRSPRAPGELKIAFESSPCAAVFQPSYPLTSPQAEATSSQQSSPAFLALEHRVGRLGGKIELCNNPEREACAVELRLVLNEATP